jgi:ParB family chromosome partitioning protein
MNARDVGPRLGRGLAALLGEAASDAPPAAAAGIRAIPVELLEPSPFQPRGPMDQAALAELTSSIRARGILQPLLARPHPTTQGHFQIIAGERRWRAAQAAGLHEVPTLVRTLSDIDAMAAALVENLQREDLNAIEEAEGYRRLIAEFGMTQEALGEAVGKSRSHIANTMRLLNLPASVQGELKKGTITAGHARALLAHPEPEKAALAVISRGLSVRQTEAMSSGRAPKGEAGSSAPSRARETDPETQALARDLSERLGLRIEIGFDGAGGTVRIHYRTLDQLDGLITLLSRD